LSERHEPATTPPSRLAGRTIVGFAQLLGLLGLALFGPAWTLDFWQAWMYLAVFTACVALITLYLWRRDPELLERRLRAGPAAETERRQQLIQLAAGVAFIGLFVMSSLDHRFGWSRVPSALSVLAAGVVALGFWIVFRVFEANTYTAATIGVTAEQHVVSTGPYAVVRHPMYAGALLMLLATPVALGSWWGMLLCVPLVAAIAARLDAEEQFLVAHLPGYAAYRDTVPYRLVPMIW
jgi:protein-S-isoprenylcysteine O-methyltransferase Ste14